MKKIIYLILSISLTLLSVSCVSTKTESTAASKVRTVIGAEGVERPEWVLSGMEAEDGIYAIGSGKMSNKVNSIKTAETNGRAELARTVQTTIKAVITTYAEDTGIEKDTLNYMEEAVVQRTAAVLQGSSRKDYWLDADGTCFVLMFLPFKSVVPAANGIVSEYAADKKTEITEKKVAEALKKYNLLPASE